MTAPVRTTEEVLSHLRRLLADATTPETLVADLISACAEMENNHLRCTAEINPDQTNPIGPDDDQSMRCHFEGRVRVGGAWITEGRPALVALRKRDAARTALVSAITHLPELLAEVEEMRARIAGYEKWESSVNAALNSGDGSYRP